MNKQLEQKLKDLPKKPGVYFHKDKSGEIIYVGKAAVLRNRVRQYFQASRNRDPKTEALVADIFDTEWIEVDSEIEALFLEAEMIRRYMPKYNILLRDDKSMTYIRIDYDSDFPTVKTTRRPLDDGAQYFGPYLSALSIRRALKLLRRAFPFATSCSLGQKRASLHYHLGLDPGLEEGKTDLKTYRANLRKLIAVIEGRRHQVMIEIEREMKKSAREQDFEQAAKLRNQLTALKNLHKQILFSDKENLDLSKDHALNDLAEIFGLEKIPRRIEGYDISHMSGTDTVASMVVFTNGVSDKASYRKFKMRVPGNDDFAHMREVISRRVSPKNQKAWGLPDLFLIDGGKGQLSSALAVLGEHDIKKPAIGLAKQFEEIIVQKDWKYLQINRKKVTSLHGTVLESDEFLSIRLPHNSHVVKLLQRIRDESHRFAVSYHSVLKTNRQTASLLDDIPTIGPVTRKKLLKTFGSMRGVMQARDEEITKTIGEKKAMILRQYIRAEKHNNQPDYLTKDL